MKVGEHVGGIGHGLWGRGAFLVVDENDSRVKPAGNDGLEQEINDIYNARCRRICYLLARGWSRSFVFVGDSRVKAARVTATWSRKLIIRDSRVKAARITATWSRKLIIHDDATWRKILPSCWGLV